jgi:hypothetical protein
LLGGVVNTNNNLVALNKYLFEWPIPSLVFAVLLFCPGMSRNRWDWFFLLSFLSLVAAYFIYYYQDLCFGPRFYFSAVPVLVILSARGFLALPSVLNKYAHKRKAAEASLYTLLACCFLYMIFCSLPSLCRKYSDDYWYVGRKFLELIEEKKVSNAIVFMDVSLPRNTSVPNLLPYGEGFLHNSPLLNTDIIYALDLGRKNSDLMSTFPGRKYYVLTYEPVPTRFKKTRPEIREMTKDTIEKVSTGLNLAVSKHYSR